VEASGDFLNRIYSKECDEYSEVNRLLNTFGKDRLDYEIKTVFSTIRSIIENHDPSRFCFRRTVYPKPTSNAQKSPFFAMFMAFYELIFKEGMLGDPPRRIGTCARRPVAIAIRADAVVGGTRYSANLQCRRLSN
jgi:hypothetical protein